MRPSFKVILSLKKGNVDYIDRYRAAEEVYFRRDQQKKRLYVTCIGNYKQISSDKIYQWQEIYFYLTLNIKVYIHKELYAYKDTWRAGGFFVLLNQYWKLLNFFTLSTPSARILEDFLLFSLVIVYFLLLLSKLQDSVSGALSNIVVWYFLQVNFLHFLSSHISLFWRCSLLS